MIDPMSSFSFIFTNLHSESVIEYKEPKYSFTNVFGTFEGVWKNDFFFLTGEKLFNFRMDYLEITAQRSRLDCDGVIGLGYSSFRKNANIYEVLGSMKNVLSMEKIFTYDKKNKTVTIGAMPNKTGNNPVIYPIYQKSEYPGVFVKLSGLGFITDKNWWKTYKEVPLNDDAMFTLMPLIIAPKKRVSFLETEYLPKLQEETSYLNYLEDQEKFYTDLYYSEPKKDLAATEVIFGKYAYKFKPYEKREHKYRAQIRFGDVEKEEFKYWFVGLDIMNADRVDFDFDKNIVKIYSSNFRDITKPRVLLLFEIIIFITIMSFVIVYVLRTMCSKKKQKDIKPEELLDEI